MKKIDINTWKRRKTYENFIKYTNPVFSIGTRLDVTNFLSFCKREGKSFFATFLYFVSECVNQSEELRTRIVNDDVVVFDRIRPSYIVILENEELVTCISEAKENFDEFYQNVSDDIRMAVDNNTARFNEEKAFDCVFISCLPWTDFTSVINPYDFADKSTTSIPRITWGKYIENAEGRVEMAFDISAHHALIDGRQISRFYEKLQNALLQPEEFIRGEK